MYISVWQLQQRRLRQCLFLCGNYKHNVYDPSISVWELQQHWRPCLFLYDIYNNDFGDHVYFCVTFTTTTLVTMSISVCQLQDQRWRQCLYLCDNYNNIGDHVYFCVTFTTTTLATISISVCQLQYQRWRSCLYLCDNYNDVDNHVYFCVAITRTTLATMSVSVSVHILPHRQSLSPLYPSRIDTHCGIKKVSHCHSLSDG